MNNETHENTPLTFGDEVIEMSQPNEVVSEMSQVLPEATATVSENGPQFTEAVKTDHSISQENTAAIETPEFTEKVKETVARVTLQEATATPQPFAQAIPTPVNVYGAQNSLPQRKLKKPMKVGWIISLVFLILSLIGIGAGSVMTANQIPAALKDLEKSTEKYPVETVAVGKLKVSGLTAGKKYTIVVIQTTGPSITEISVDGVKAEKSNVTQSIKLNAEESKTTFYMFDAKAGSATLSLKGATKDSTGKIIVTDDSYISNLMNVGIGVIIVAASFFIALFSFILFLIFLIIFLVKNSKYKQSLRA